MFFQSCQVSTGWWSEMMGIGHKPTSISSEASQRIYVLLPRTILLRRLHKRRRRQSGCNLSTMLWPGVPPRQEEQRSGLAPLRLSNGATRARSIRCSFQQTNFRSRSRYASNVTARVGLVGRDYGHGKPDTTSAYSLSCAITCVAI